MKKILYTLAAIFIGCILSCTPDKDEVLEMGLVDMDHIKEIKLRTSQPGRSFPDRVLHLVGRNPIESILDFRPITYRENTQRVRQDQRFGSHLEYNNVHGYRSFRFERLHGDHDSGNIPLDSIQQGYS